MAEETITLKLIAQDLASGNIGKAIGSIDKLAQRGGIVGSVFQGVGQRFGQMLNPLALAQRGFDLVTDVIGDAVHAAAEEEAAIKQLSTAISANDKSWDGNIAKVEQVIQSRQRLAFADGEQREGLQLLVGATKDVTEAQELLAVAMDFARFRNIDLRTSADLLGRAYAGNFATLSRYGVVLQKGATATEALAQIQKMASGQAAAYAETTQGKLVRAQIAANDAMEDLGRILTPLAGNLAQFAADTIPKLAEGFQTIAEELQPLLDAILLQDPWWNEWKAKVQAAGAEAGMTSEEIAQLTALIELNKNALSGNLSELEKNTALQAILDKAIEDYSAHVFSAAGKTKGLTEAVGDAADREKLMAERTKALQRQLDIVADISLPDLRESARDTFQTFVRELERTGNPLKTLQREERALMELRRQAGKEGKTWIQVGIDARLDEIRTQRQALRAAQQKYDEEDRLLRRMVRQLGITQGAALTLLRTTQRDYSIDIDVDDSGISRAIQNVRHLQALLLDPKVPGVPPPPPGEDRKTLAQRRQAELKRQQDAYRDLTSQVRAHAEAEDKGSGASKKGAEASKADAKAAREAAQEKARLRREIEKVEEVTGEDYLKKGRQGLEALRSAAERASKDMERSFDRVKQAASKVSDAVQAISATDFVDLRESGQESLEALRASLLEQIQPMEEIRAQVAQLRDLRAQALAQERFDIAAAIDLRLRELALLEQQYLMVRLRYTDEHKALDILTEKLDISVRKAKELLDVYGRKADAEGLTDTELARIIVRKRQHGGPAMAGMPYLVGERGPELFVPSQSGYVSPGAGGGFVYAPMFSTASPAEAQRFAQAVTPYIERERRRIA